MTQFEWIQSAASIFTAIAVVVAAIQLHLTRKQAQLAFEDKFFDRYREIVGQLPLDALLGKSISEDQLEKSLRYFYDYFDVSNTQARLAGQEKLNPETWRNWQKGILRHMRRPSFQKAWEKLLPDLGESFRHLKDLLHNNS